MSLGAFMAFTLTETNELYHNVLSRLWDILKTPIHNPEILWIISPVILAMVLIAFYFGEYKEEELGWNTAFGNSIVLMFACVDLFRYLHNNSLLGFNTQTVLVTVILGEGLIMTLLDYLHALPKTIAFGLSSGLTVNSIMLCLIMIIYSEVPLDYVTAISVGIMATALVLLLRIMQLLQWGKDEEESQ